MGLITGGTPPIKIGKHVPDKNVNGIWTKKLLQNVSTGGAGAGKTWGAILKAPCSDFTHVRLIFANQESTPGAITDIAVAVTTSNTDTVTPTTGNTLTNDGSTGWVRGTFNGNNGVTLPTAGIDANNPGTLASDWIPINSIAPTDGSSLPYIMARVIYSNTFSYLFQGLDASTTDNTKASYMETYHTGGSVNAISDPTQLSNTNKTSDSATPFYAFEFLSSQHCIRTVCIGDSITNGFSGSNLTAGGWWQQAQDLFIANGYPINLFQSAIGGTTTSQYSTFGKLNITQHQPAVALYSLISPNDNPSGAYSGGLSTKLMNAQYQRALDFANYCRSNSVLPVFTILTPNNSYSAADDAFRLAVIAKAKAASIPVIDLTPAIATTGSPQQFISGLNSDAVHPNSSGYAVMASNFVSQYLALLSQSFTLR
jgi:lysophospholipase L1-like esterase